MKKRNKYLAALLLLLPFYLTAQLSFAAQRDFLLDSPAYIKGYKKMLGQAAESLRNSKVRLRAELFGYTDDEEGQRAIAEVKKELESYLKLEYGIEVISFVPVFYRGNQSVEGQSLPVIEFSLFSDERLSLPMIAEVLKEEVSVFAEAPSGEEPERIEHVRQERIAYKGKAARAYSPAEIKSINHNRKGIVLYREGKYGLAFTEFVDSVISDPSNVNARFNLGVAYQLQGRYGEAIVEFQKALKIADMPRIHVMLGAVYVMQGRYNDALEEFNNVVFFESGKTLVGPADVKVIARFAQMIKKGIQNNVLVLEGHTDSIGSSSTNRKISRDRAISVAMELMAMNSVEPDLIFIKGSGESDPLAPNSSEAGRRLNRRVEMFIKKNGDLR